jgi:ABC-type spermidine/putrescine transport system permease subunit I
MSAVASEEINRALLMRDERREQTRILLLAAPALTIIFVVVVLPLFWMLRISLTGAGGGPSLENYRTLLADGTNIGVIAATLKVAGLVTLVAALIGYPIAYLMVQLTPGWTRALMIAIMMPYMTSVLVLTYAWIMLLGRRGIVNNVLTGIGLLDDPLPLLFNTTANVIGMAHYMLPLFVLPLYATMRTIDRTWLRAAASLGASPTVAFWKVYFPLSLPGLLAGALLIFVISLAFFIIPAVLGGGRVMMIAQQIANSISTYDGFGVAGALGIMLLVVVSSILLIAARIARLEPSRFRR